MTIMVYRSVKPDNIFRLCSLGGHDQEDAAQAFQFLFANVKEKMGVLLDVQNGLPTLPKESAAAMARQAQELGVEKGAMAVLAKEDEVEEMKNRYEKYPQLANGIIGLEVQVFTCEIEATKWLVELVD